ncbi:MAG: DUF4286 family protein [Gammaproteobacteria bacterium]|nr:DUF4286 family protein [Gammaproteobacteria bacterium]MDH3414768.1 DUF4286 family protein [Gammaproteobacteria bacterium]
MPTRSGPVYEVSFIVDASVRDDFDNWLREHVSEISHVAGIADCSYFPMAGRDDGRSGCVCLYVFDSDDALDNFLEGVGTDIPSDVTSRFRGLVTTAARVLREDSTLDLAPAESADCLNCGTRLKGQYCGNCGQRSRSRLISLWELISDAFGDLFELDSRLWQTLVPLMIRPGQLTHDYLQGRRARYMPPFRMYLVLSLLFFVIAFFDPREELGLLFEPQPEQTSAAAADGEIAVPDEAIDEAQQVLDELAADGVLPDVELSETADTHGGGFILKLDDDGEEIEVDGDCDVESSELEELPGWIARRLTPERLKRICEKTQIDGGKAFVDKLVDNIPAALIVLLPLMALVLKALYPLSKRYYVEHLLFFVHFHAFFFLILTLQILLMRISTMLVIPEAIPIVTVVVTSFYVPVYLFKSMRQVYGQGWFVSLLKFVVLVFSYLIGFFATMMGALAIAAFSI